MIRIVKGMLWCSAAFLAFVALAAIARSMFDRREIAADPIAERDVNVGSVGHDGLPSASEGARGERTATSPAEASDSGADRVPSTRRDRNSTQPPSANRDSESGSSRRVSSSGTPVTVTREIEPGVWQISADERDRIRDSAKNLLEEAEVSTYLNERTRRAEGMIVDHIEPKSLVAARGLREGDLVRRINGTPISSKSELIAYVKSNADRLYDVRVEVLRRGKSIVLEYHAPR